MKVKKLIEDLLKYMEKKSENISFSDIKANFVRLSKIKLDESEAALFGEAILKYIDIVVNISSKKDYRHQIKFSRQCLEIISEIITEEFHVIFVNTVTQRVLDILIEEDISGWCIKKEILKMFITCIENMKKEIRYNATKALSDIYLFKIIDSISTYGDFDFQVLLIEAVFRMYGKNTILPKLKDLLPESEELSQSFANINGETFDEDVRKFLNTLNKITGKVFSIICKAVFIGRVPCREPMENIGGLWVDFNLSENIVSFYCAKEPLPDKIPDQDDSAWNLEMFFVSDVDFVQVYRLPEKNEVIIFMKLHVPCVNSQNEIHGNVSKTKDIKFIVSCSPEATTLTSKILPGMFKHKFRHDLPKVSISKKLVYKPLKVSITRRARSNSSKTKSDVSVSANTSFNSFFQSHLDPLTSNSDVSSSRNGRRRCSTSSASTKCEVISISDSESGSVKSFIDLTSKQAKIDLEIEESQYESARMCLAEHSRNTQKVSCNILTTQDTLFDSNKLEENGQLQILSNVVKHYHEKSQKKISINRRPLWECQNSDSDCFETAQEFFQASDIDLVCLKKQTNDRAVLQDIFQRRREQRLSTASLAKRELKKKVSASLSKQFKSKEPRGKNSKNEEDQLVIVEVNKESPENQNSDLGLTKHKNHEITLQDIAQKKEDEQPSSSVPLNREESSGKVSARSSNQFQTKEPSEKKGMKQEKELLKSMEGDQEVKETAGPDLGLELLSRKKSRGVLEDVAQNEEEDCSLSILPSAGDGKKVSTPLSKKIQANKPKKRKMRELIKHESVEGNKENIKSTAQHDQVQISVEDSNTNENKEKSEPKLVKVNGGWRKGKSSQEIEELFKVTGGYDLLEGLSQKGTPNIKEVLKVGTVPLTTCEEDPKKTEYKDGCKELLNGDEYDLLEDLSQKNVPAQGNTEGKASNNINKPKKNRDSPEKMKKVPSQDVEDVLQEVSWKNASEKEKTQIASNKTKELKRDQGSFDRIEKSSNSDGDDLLTESVKKQEAEEKVDEASKGRDAEKTGEDYLLEELPDESRQDQDNSKKMGEVDIVEDLIEESGGKNVPNEDEMQQAPETQPRTPSDTTPKKDNDLRQSQDISEKFGAVISEGRDEELDMSKVAEIQEAADITSEPRRYQDISEKLDQALNKDEEVIQEEVPHKGRIQKTSVRTVEPLKTKNISKKMVQGEGSSQESSKMKALGVDEMQKKTGKINKPRKGQEEFEKIEVITKEKSNLPNENKAHKVKNKITNAKKGQNRSKNMKKTVLNTRTGEKEVKKQKKQNQRNFEEIVTVQESTSIRGSNLEELETTKEAKDVKKMPQCMILLPRLIEGFNPLELNEKETESSKVATPVSEDFVEGVKRIKKLDAMQIEEASQLMDVRHDCERLFDSLKEQDLEESKSIINNPIFLKSETTERNEQLTTYSQETQIHTCDVHREDEPIGAGEDQIGSPKQEELSKFMERPRPAESEANKTILNQTLSTTLGRRRLYNPNDLTYLDAVEELEELDSKVERNTATLRMKKNLSVEETKQDDEEIKTLSKRVHRKKRGLFSSSKHEKTKSRVEKHKRYRFKCRPNVTLSVDDNPDSLRLKSTFFEVLESFRGDLKTSLPEIISAGQAKKEKIDKRKERKNSDNHLTEVKKINKNNEGKRNRHSKIRERRRRHTILAERVGRDEPDTDDSDVSLELKGDETILPKKKINIISDIQIRPKRVHSDDKSDMQQKRAKVGYENVPAGSGNSRRNGDIITERRTFFKLLSMCSGLKNLVREPDESEEYYDALAVYDTCKKYV